MRRWAPLIAVAFVLAAVAAFFVLREVAPPSFESFDPQAEDPFAYSEGRRSEFERRAAAGFSHVVYDKSPDGAENTAERVAAYRPLIEAEARRSDLDPDMLEALVFLESAGRPDAVAGKDLESAAGLTQIIAGTGAGLLDMKVDVEQSTRLTRAIRRAARRGDARRVRRLEARRRRVDERFDPRKALAGTGRYLRFARERLGPRGPGLRRLPHGRGEPAARAGPARRGPHPVRPAVLRLHADQPPPHLRLLLHAERRLGQLPVAGAGGQGDHAPAPRRPGRARAAGRAAHREGLGGGGAPSPGRHRAVRGARRPRRGAGQRRPAAVRRGRDRGRPAARPAHGRAGAAAGGRAAPVPRRCGPARTRSRPTWRG